MRVVYRVPIPAVSQKRGQVLAYDSAAYHWQQFFAPHGGVSFLAEVVQGDVHGEWREGDWLVVDESLSPHEGSLMVVSLHDAMYVYRYTYRHNLPVLESLDGSEWIDNLINVQMLGVVAHQVRQVG